MGEDNRSVVEFRMDWMFGAFELRKDSLSLMMGCMKSYSDLGDLF